VLLALWFFCSLCVAPSEAQTLIHTEKVQIKPRAATDSGDADVFRIWGGLQAGPNGDIQVINADGTISGTSGIADGSITFAKWASNSCASGNIPQWNGSSWVCSTVSGSGGLAESDNAIITGDWRFSTNTLFGDATTAQQLIHAYKSGAAAAVRIEQGGSAWWDLTSTGTSLTIGTNSGTQATWTTTGLGILKTPTTALDVLGTATVTGLAVNGQVASHLIPSATDTYDLGSSEKLWRQSFISQINAVIFAEQTATLMGGYTIIAKDAGSFDQAVASAATNVDFGKSMTPGHFVLVRAHDTAGTIRAEYLQVGALVGGTIYSVTRDLAGVSSPDPAWPDGTPFMVLGTLGDGRIELNAYNTPKITFVTQGATYGSVGEPLRLGALDGMPGVAAGKFGLYLGDTTSAGMSFYDSTLLIRGEVRATSGWFGNSSAQGVAIDSTGLSVGSTGAIRNGSTSYSSGTGYFLGVDAGSHKFRVGSTTDYIRWNGTSLDIVADGGSLTNIDGGNIQTGTVTATQLSADSVISDKIQAGTIVASDIASSTITGTQIAASTITAANIAASTITSTQIQAGSITTDRLLVSGLGLALNSDPDTKDLSAWTLWSGTSFTIETVTDGAQGPTVLRSNGAGSALMHSNKVPYDNTAKSYAIRGWARRSSGADGDLYLGLFCFDSGGTLVNALWSAANAATPSTSFGHYQAEFGVGSCSSTARTIALAVALNYEGTTGYHEAQGLILAEQTSSVLIRDGAITAAKITASAVTTDKLDADSVTSAKIAAGTITAGDIQSGTITATQIQSGSITADRLSVSSLSAISANIGSITAGSISGVTITGGAVTLDSNGIDIDSGSGASNSIKFDGNNVINLYGGGLRLSPPSGNASIYLIAGSSGNVEISGSGSNSFSVSMAAVFGGSVAMPILSGSGNYVCIDGSGNLYKGSGGC
jgi:hypothetical protein